MFERLRDALRVALEAATPPRDLRDLVRQMREAVVEAKLAVADTRDALARTERELAADQREGLNDPLPIQLGHYLNNLLHGDLGDSVSQRRPVSDILVERLPTTIELATIALTLAILIGVPLGVIAARRRNSATDVFTMVGANVGVSMPVFWLGLMLQFLFAVTLKNTFPAMIVPSIAPTCRKAARA